MGKKNGNTKPSEEVPQDAPLKILDPSRRCNCGANIGNTRPRIFIECEFTQDAKTGEVEITGEHPVVVAECTACMTLRSW